MAWSKDSRHARGYGSKWDKLRLLILRRDCGICQCPTCKANDRTTPATEVNHITPKAEAKRLKWTDEQIDDPSNLQAVNTECHKRLTAEQRGKTYAPRPAIGRDGWPQR